jgi:hypothetical protein
MQAGLSGAVHGMGGGGHNRACAPELAGWLGHACYGGLADVPLTGLVVLVCLQLTLAPARHDCIRSHAVLDLCTWLIGMLPPKQVLQVFQVLQMPVQARRCRRWPGCSRTVMVKAVAGITLAEPEQQPEQQELLSTNAWTALCSTWCLSTQPAAAAAPIQLPSIAASILLSMQERWSSRSAAGPRGADAAAGPRGRGAAGAAAGVQADIPQLGWSLLSHEVSPCGQHHQPACRAAAGSRAQH